MRRRCWSTRSRSSNLRRCGQIPHAEVRAALFLCSLAKREPDRWLIAAALALLDARRFDG
jgi:hypothetical protein